MDKDLGFVGEQYSLLVLLFYIPNGLCDLPLNMLTKRWSGKIVLPSCMGPCFALLVCTKLLIRVWRSNGWLGCLCSPSVRNDEFWGYFGTSTATWVWHL